MYPRVKRILDTALAALMLIALAPLLAAISIMICLDSPGPVFFLQRRVGRGGRLFRIYKFRTMYTYAPRSVATSMLLNAPGCITPLGRKLRKSSIDELPQLINVLRGEMSLIGPRPLVPEEGEIHEERAALGAYGVRPGITGWAQVNGRDCVNARTKAQLDAYYANNLSWRLDVKVLLYSVMCVITARGIQEGGGEINDEIEGEIKGEIKDAVNGVIKGAPYASSAPISAVNRMKPRVRQNEWFARYDIESARVYPRTAREPRAPGA